MDDDLNRAKKRKTRFLNQASCSSLGGDTKCGKVEQHSPPKSSARSPRKMPTRSTSVAPTCVTLPSRLPHTHTLLLLFPGDPCSRTPKREEDTMDTTNPVDLSSERYNPQMYMDGLDLLGRDLDADALSAGTGSR